MRWNRINWDTMWKKLFPTLLSKQLIVHDKLIAFCSLPRLCKISFPAFLVFFFLLFLFFYCGGLSLVLPACLANAKERNWHLLGPSLFVFQLSAHHMSAFMSSLRQNIKAAHSLLIFAMTTQSFRHTKFIVCACASFFKKSGYTHFLKNILYLLACVQGLHRSMSSVNVALS